MARVKYFRKTRLALRKLKRAIRRRVPLFTICAVIITGGVIFAIMHKQPTIDPTAYAPLLTTIAKGESNGNYNAYFGHGENQSIHFTDMTIDQVLAWQDDYVKQGSASSAVGRYQFLNSTLKGLRDQLKLSSKTKFNDETQDTLAIALIERRGAVSFVEQKLTPEAFAKNLSQEWASLPTTTGMHPEKSYYDGDGLNSAQIKPSEILGAIDMFQTEAVKK